MKPQKPNLLQRMKAAESAPRIQLEDVANLCIALRRGGMMAMSGQDLINVATSLARCEAVCQQFVKPQQPSAATPPAEKPAEPTKS
jgi:hypothetical protein